jgi:hypothetical protein
MNRDILTKGSLLFLGLLAAIAGLAAMLVHADKVEQEGYQKAKEADWNEPCRDQSRTLSKVSFECPNRLHRMHLHGGIAFCECERSAEKLP